MKKPLILLALAAMFVSACGAQTPAPQPAPLATATARKTATAVPPTSTVLPSAIPEPTATATPAVTLFPTVTFTEKTVCRLGPDANYYPVVTYLPGQTSQAQARSEDGEWLVIMSQVPIKSSTCWVPVASVEELRNTAEMTVSIAPPLPVGPSRMTASKGVCGVNRTGPIVLQWFPAVDGTGYYLYRNGKNIATVFGSQYLERDTPSSKTPYVYTYGVQAFNSVGLSKVTASVSVTLCK